MFRLIADIFSRLRHRDPKAIRQATAFLIIIASAVAVAVATATIWLIRLDQDIRERFAQKRFAPPIEFYAAPETFAVGQHWPVDDLTLLFARHAYTERSAGQSMRAGDFAVWSQSDCRQWLGAELDSRVSRCFAYINRSDGTAGASAPSPLSTATPRAYGRVLALANDGTVIGALDLDNRQPVTDATSAPEMFAQYYGDTPILRNIVSIEAGDVPPMCLNALIAIEDPRFFEHRGVSVRGLLRAVYTNLLHGGYAQGGSTLTQQLVKNYFLTSKKTLQRKLSEMAMSILLERRIAKQDILETYINLIYMGQNGPFEVRGFSAASDHHFGKPLRQLELADCALMAAMVASPGYYDPSRHPDHAQKRRTRVLDKMLEQKLISQAQYNQANQAPLPSKPARLLSEPAPYFVQSVRRLLNNKKLDLTNGARVYTTLSFKAQEAAQQALRTGIDQLEASQPKLKSLHAAGKNLEGVLISADPQSGAVRALVGGRGFAASSFNRAFDSHRQVGSIMKPFVYLTALKSNATNGQPYSPTTLVDDRMTTHSYQGRSWTPHNYEPVYHGSVPLYYALKESLNAATANLGMAIGLDRIIETAHRAGIDLTLLPYPSLTLGAFELTPYETLQAYATLANFGVRAPLVLYTRVSSLDGRELDSTAAPSDVVFEPEIVAELISMMKQTLVSGTARTAAKLGFTLAAAGKTGTTNDKKDAWFVGFTPEHVALTWIGYDDNTPLGLTGATGALPIWVQYMKNYSSKLSGQEFHWPEGTQTASFLPDAHLEKPIQPVTLVFKQALAPK